MQIPQISKADPVSNKFKSLVNKSIVKTTPFMGDDVQIRKLSVAQVLEIQAAAAAKPADGQEAEGFKMIMMVIRMSVDGAAEATDEDFKTFPMDELTKLSNEIMEFSGISGGQGK